MFKEAWINISDLARYLWLARQIVGWWDRWVRPIPNKYLEPILNYLSYRASLSQLLYESIKKSIDN